jgi:hypothetical protein
VGIRIKRNRRTQKPKKQPKQFTYKDIKFITPILLFICIYVFKFNNCDPGLPIQLAILAAAVLSIYVFVIFTENKKILGKSQYKKNIALIVIFTVAFFGLNHIDDFLYKENLRIVVALGVTFTFFWTVLIAAKAYGTYLDFDFDSAGFDASKKRFFLLSVIVAVVLSSMLGRYSPKPKDAVCLFDSQKKEEFRVVPSETVSCFFP